MVFQLNFKDPYHNIRMRLGNTLEVCDLYSIFLYFDFFSVQKAEAFLSYFRLKNPLFTFFFFSFLKIFISFLKQRFTIFTKTQVYNNKITIATTTRSSFLELFLKAGAPQKYTK